MSSVVSESIQNCPSVETVLSFVFIYIEKQVDTEHLVLDNFDKVF